MRRQAGQLREKIRIWRVTDGVDDSGYPVEQNELVAQVWARAQAAAYRELYAAAATNITNIVNFTIRYRKGIEPGMWVEHEGARRRIVDVNAGTYDRQYLILKTTMTEGVGL